MPLYLKHKFVFIHIPKTGGSSIEKVLEDAGDTTLLYNNGANPGVLNGHSPQHSTYRELVDLKLIPNDFTVFSVVRNPYDRFMSDYNFHQEHHLFGFDGTVEEFAEFFWSEKVDNHNGSMTEYLKDKDGTIPGIIKIMRFEQFPEDFRGLTGLEMNKHELSSKKFIKELPEEVKEIVRDKWGEDFDNFNYQK